MSKQLVAVGAAALTLAVTAVVVDESPGGRSPARRMRAQVAAGGSETLTAGCPRHTPRQIPINSWTVARQVLAPAGPRTIRLCRYSGLDDHPRLALVRSATITAKALVHMLVHELDVLSPMRGEVGCSLDDGSEIIALLAYPDGHAVVISVGLRGCELMTNGSVYRAAAAIGSFPAGRTQLVAQLERLTAARPRARRTRAVGRPSLSRGRAALRGRRRSAGGRRDR